MPKAWVSFAKSAPSSSPTESDDWTLIGVWGANPDEALRKSVNDAPARGPLKFYLSLDTESDWVATFLAANPNAGRGLSLSSDPGPFWLVLDKFGPGVVDGPFFVMSAERARFGTVGTRPPESHPGHASTVVNVGIWLPSRGGRHFRPLG